MTKWADPSEVAEASQQWDDQIVSCRIYGHLWRPLNVTKDGTGYTVTQHCIGCKNRRWQSMDLNGYASAWHYRYVNQNYVVKDLGRIDSDGRAVLRLAALRHLKVEEVAE